MTETRRAWRSARLERGTWNQKPQSSTASDPCPDPDVLAAFVERNLSKPEAQRLEHHLAACGRCQAQMATMIRSLDAAEPAPRHTLDVVKNAWRWLAPLAAAAMVVLAVWVLDPELVRESGKPRNPLTPTLSPVPGERGQPAQESRVAAAPPPAEPRSDASARNLPSRADSQSPANAEQAALRAPGAETAAGRSEATRISESAPSRSAALADRRSGVAGGVVGGVIDEQVGLSVSIPTPNPSVVWRIRPPGIIERSTDGGASWQVQLADAPSELLAGSAVSDVVCWVVGRGGVVMRTADGMRWERVTAPTATDLVAVAASEATSTIVTTATGERYQTNDGGRTWTEIRR